MEKRPGTVIEVHPEVVFTTLNEQVGDATAALAGKQTWRGHLQRCDLLTSVDLSPREFKLNQPTSKTGPGIDRVGPDDVLDAIAAAWVAGRWSRQDATRLGPEARNSDQPMWT